MQPEEPNKYVKELTQEKYKYGFTTDVHTEVIERGLNEDVVRLISAKKNDVCDFHQWNGYGGTTAAGLWHGIGIDYDYPVGESAG